MEMVLNEKIYINKRFLLGLYALLRQIDLSWDRARWSTSKDDLKQYLLSDNRIDQAIRMLKSYIPNEQFYLCEFILKESLTERIKLKLINSNYLTVGEIKSIGFLLVKIKNHEGEYHNNMDFVKIIRRMNTINYNIIKHRLTLKDQNLAMLVECFNAGSVETKSINEISPDWSKVIQKI